MEKTIEKYLVSRVESLGGLCVKFPPLFFAGFPDRIVMLPGGRIVFAETKAPGETPRAIQRKVHARLCSLGFRVEVLDSKESINKFIAGL